MVPATKRPQPSAPPRPVLPLMLRLALRDLRGGLKGFGIFLACIGLGVAAISGVGSVSRALTDGLARQGATILGGDAAFSLIHRDLNEAERSWLSAHGRLSTVATLRAMARKQNGDSTLIEIKAVDASYPERGNAVLDPPQPLQDALNARNGLPAIAADAALLARLDLHVGDTLLIGELPVELRATLVSEPDKLAGGVGFGPRVMMTQDTLRATGLLQPGSLVRWITRVSLAGPAPDRPADEAAVARFTDDAGKAFPEAGWEVRTRSNVSPNFAKNIERFTQFLTLVGLTALVVGGVGVANAVRLYVDRKRATIATMKSFGATGGTVFLITLSQVLLIAVLGIAIGLVAGACLPVLIVSVFRSLIPLPLAPAVYPRELALGLAYGLLTTLVFAFGPLGRVHDVPASALFRDHIEPDAAWPRRRYLAMIALAALALIATAILYSTDRYLAIIYVSAAIAAFVLLRLVATGLMIVARHLPHSRWPELRLAVANIHRPGALTPAVVLSLGLGLALLVTLTLVDHNIRDQLSRASPGKTPSFFFLDVQNAQAPAFDAFLRRLAGDSAKIERVPMMRGRLMKVKDQRAEDVKARESASWVLEGDRGITYADHLPEGSTLVAGEWWQEGYAGPPLVSVEKEIADGLGLTLGDAITVNVFGRNIAATIANLRTVDWRTLGINFVFVFSANTFAGAPHTHLATVTFIDGGNPAVELQLLRDVARAYPAVTSVRVKDALDAVNTVVSELALAIRGASGVALTASILVLAGALAAGQRARIYDAVVLKTLGATRWRLLTAYLLEYALVGSATAVFGLLAGTSAAWLIIARVMNFTFVPVWPSALAAAGMALVITVGLGLMGTWRILGLKPAPYLRQL